MNAVKMLEVIELYKTGIEELNPAIAAEDMSSHGISSGMVLIAHCKWMLTQMEEQAKTGDLEKAMRWLCFIQGAMCFHLDFSISDFRDQVRSILKD